MEKGYTIRPEWKAEGKVGKTFGPYYADELLITGTEVRLVKQGVEVDLAYLDNQGRWHIGEADEEWVEQWHELHIQAADVSFDDEATAYARELVQKSWAEEHNTPAPMVDDLLEPDTIQNPRDDSKRTVTPSQARKLAELGLIWWCEDCELYHLDSDADWSTIDFHIKED